jgi:hypothetical protein
MDGETMIEHQFPLIYYPGRRRPFGGDFALGYDISPRSGLSEKFFSGNC